MIDDIDAFEITGIDRAELLAALYNGTRALGLGRLIDERHLTRAEATTVLLEATEDASYATPGRLMFDYVKGRPIKVWFDGDVLRHAGLYDRDAPGGPGSCQRIVDSLRQKPRGRA